MRPRIVALGADFARDDGAALQVADELARDPALGAEVVRAGRPGPALIDQLADPEAPGRPVLLLDVVRAGLEPGQLIEMRLDELLTAAVPGSSLSSHGFGAAEALRLGAVLGRSLPAGRFVGVEGLDFEPGPGLSAPVQAALPAFIHAARQALDQLQENDPCTSPA